MFRFGRMVDARVRGVLSAPRLACVVLVVLAVGVLPAGASAAGCSQMVSSVSAATSAVSSAARRGRWCAWRTGPYGAVSLNATKAAPGVTLQAEHPGLATIGGVDVAGQ